MSTPAPSGIVTLLTDFGLSDPFVGVMTGVLLRGHPTARIVDLCHGIEPQATTEAAFWVQRCYPWFPEGTVHLIVVDPAVGTGRALLAARLQGHYFVAPDAGLLPDAVASGAAGDVRAIDCEALGLASGSATFHGRDRMAPVAALLSSGRKRLEQLGPPIEPAPCALPLAARLPSGDVRGEIVTIDRFGNLMTNLEAEHLAAARRVQLGERSIPVVRTYADAGPGGLVALINSFGVLEIARRDGSAAEALGAGRGAVVEVTA